MWHHLHSQSESLQLGGQKVICLMQNTKCTQGGDNRTLIIDIGVTYFGMSDHLFLFPKSSIHHRQSGHHPATPHQVDKHGPEGHSCHQMGMGLRGLNRNLNYTSDFDFVVVFSCVQLCDINFKNTHDMAIIQIHSLLAFPNDIMMSAVPSKRRVKVSGVTSLHTLKALAKASSVRELSMSGE